MMKDTKNGNAEQSEMGLTLEELIWRSARELIQKAIEVEARDLLAEYENVKMIGEQRAEVRGGYLPERQVLKAVDPVDDSAIRVPREVKNRWVRRMDVEAYRKNALERAP